MPGVRIDLIRLVLAARNQRCKEPAPPGTLAFRNGFVPFILKAGLWQSAYCCAHAATAREGRLERVRRGNPLSPYKKDFYTDRHAASHYSAKVILGYVYAMVPGVRSAVDLGCGVGTWLSVLSERGVEDILGFDGPWVDTTLLEIPRHQFRVLDLEKPVTFDRKYDLAISLEVAEHLKPESASMFVESLTRAADFVLFSGAIPYQGGSSHVNEQWPEYWAELFDERGFEVLDCIRSCIWTDDRIPTWYRQNTFLYVRRERLPEVRLERGGTPFPMLSVVNPDAFVNKLSTLKVTWRTFRKALVRSAAARLDGVRPTGRNDD